MYIQLSFVYLNCLLEKINFIFFSYKLIYLFKFLNDNMNLLNDPKKIGFLLNDCSFFNIFFKFKEAYFILFQFFKSRKSF